MTVCRYLLRVKSHNHSSTTAFLRSILHQRNRKCVHWYRAFLRR